MEDEKKLSQMVKDPRFMQTVALLIIALTGVVYFQPTLEANLVSTFHGLAGGSLGSWFGLTIISTGFLGAYFLLSLFWTGGITLQLLLRKIFGGHFVGVKGADKVIRLVPAKKQGGMYVTKKYGAFAINPDGIYQLQNDVRVMFVVEGHTEGINLDTSMENSIIINDPLITENRIMNEKVIESAKDQSVFNYNMLIPMGIVIILLLIGGVYVSKEMSCTQCQTELAQYKGISVQQSQAPGLLDRISTPSMSVMEETKK